MGIDIRYYIVSLIAIFLAMAVGLVVGIFLVPSTAMLDRQNAIISSLEEDFEKIREETRLLRKNLEINMRFEKEVLPYVVNGIIAGKNICVIDTTMGKNIYNSTKETIEAGGGNLSYYLSYEEKFKFLTEKEIEKIKEFIPVQTNNTSELLSTIASCIAKEIIGGEENEKIIPYLRRNKFIRVHKNDKNEISSIVMIGGQDNGEDYSTTLDTPMIQVFLSHNIRVIGTETTDVLTSYIPTYKKLKIPTVDNIETYAGKIALLLVLAGEDGNFGIKDTATRLLPKYRKL